MTSAARTEPRSFALGARERWIALVAVIAATLLAYSNTLHVPFLFDDFQSVVENETIRDLREIGTVLSPPAKAGVGGRPISNLSLAVNYAVGGLAPPGYHVVNLAIHALAGLTLFGLLRRTLRRPAAGTRIAAQADFVALTATALWLLHPLQTVTVNYVSQRTEALMALFYLLTLYCLARGVDSARPRRWFGAMIAAALLGAGSKEIIATAPLLALLYDRTFVAGSFAAAWRARWRWHLALAASVWALLAWLMRDVSERGAGFGAGEVPAWVYALTSCRTLLEYLRLGAWPQPLIFDRGAGVAPPTWALAPYAAAAGALAAAVVFMLWRRPAIGLGAAWFFIVLAPTTSVVPVAFQPVAENRVYLALAGPLALLAAGLHRAMGPRALVVSAALAAAVGAASFARNRDYRSALSIWEDTMAKQPTNARALNSHGWALHEAGRVDEALRQFERAIQMGRDTFDLFVAQHSIGRALLQLGRFAEAAECFRRAVELWPKSVEARNNLGTALLQMGDPAAALTPLEAAAKLEPRNEDVQLNRALALARLGRRAEALAVVEEVVQTRPTSADARRHFASLLATTGRRDEAAAQFARAVELAPREARARLQFGEFLAQHGRMPEARAQFEEAVRLQPDSAAAHQLLGAALAALGELTPANAHFAQSIRLRPDYAPARNNFAAALAAQGRLDEARAQLEEAVRLQPDNAEWRENLARLRAQTSAPR